MTPNEYQSLAMRTMADQQTIMNRLTVQGVQLDTGLRGLCDEVGEIASLIKKHNEYGQPLNLDGLKEEVGDALWRLAQICDAGGFTIEDAMKGNIRKLKIRYPEKYTDERAADENRDREAEAYTLQGVLEYRPKSVKEGPGGEKPMDVSELDRQSARELENYTAETRRQQIEQDGHGFGHVLGGEG